MSFAAPDPAYCRLTVLAPRTRVDVALPADLPVAELVPMLLELVGEPVFGVRPRPWRLFGAAGVPLSSGHNLRELGVLDGDLVRIAPDGPGPPPPVFDDPVDALAATGGTAGADGGRVRSAAVPLLSAAAAVLVIGGPTPAATTALLDTLATPVTPTALVLIAALAAAAAPGYAGWLVRRPDLAPDPVSADDGDRWSDDGNEPAPDRPPPERTPATEPHPTDAEHRTTVRRPSIVHNLPAATAVALGGVPLAAVAGWAALPGAAVPARLLVATAAAGAAAAAAQLAVRVLVPALVGVLVAALAGGVAAVAVLRLAVPPTTAAIGVGAVALVAGPLLPRAALWLSGMPRPVVPGDAAELVAADYGPDLLPAAELVERADQARGYLAGLAGGCAVVAAAAALPAAATPGWAGPVLAGVTVTLLGLRARSFVDPRPARTLAASAVAAGVGMAVLLAWSGEPWARPVAAAGLLLAAVVFVRVAGRARAAGSPVRRRAIDLGEGLLTTAVVPLALGAADLYALVRAL